MSPCLKSDWFREINLFQIKTQTYDCKGNPSKFFPVIGSNEIGR